MFKTTKKKIISNRNYNITELNRPIYIYSLHNYFCCHLWQYDFLSSVGYRRAIFQISKEKKYISCSPFVFNHVFSQMGYKETCPTGYLNVICVHLGQRWSMRVQHTVR